MWACLEVFFYAGLISSQPLSGSFLSLLGTSHTSSVLGHRHLAGGERWSWCQQSSYKACHLFQAAQDAFWAPCPVSNPENNFWEHAPRTTVLSDQLQFEHDKWKNGNLLCRSCSVQYIHLVKLVLWMMIIWCNNGHHLTKQSGSPLWGLLCSVPQTDEGSPPCPDGCQGGWGKGNVMGNGEMGGHIALVPLPCLAKASP